MKNEHDFKAAYSRMEKASSWRDGCTVQEQEAVIAALRIAESRQWQPIETAPRDGTNIILFYTFLDSTKIHVINSHNSYLHGGDDLWMDMDDTDNILGWMPLPKPPTETLVDREEFKKEVLEMLLQLQEDYKSRGVHLFNVEGKWAFRTALDEVKKKLEEM